MGLANSFFHFVDDGLWGLNDMVLRQRSNTYCHLETIDGEEVLVAEDGSMGTMFEVFGILKAVDPADFLAFLGQLTDALGGRLGGPGYALQVVYDYLPEGGALETAKVIDPSIATAKNMDLHAEWLLNDWKATVSKYVSSERQMFILWTRPYALASALRKDARQQFVKSQAEVPSGSRSMRFGRVMTALREPHFGYVDTVKGTLRGSGLLYEVLSNRDASRVLRQTLLPGMTADTWTPTVPGDPLPLRRWDYETRPNDLAAFNYPRLCDQVWPAEVETPNRTMVVVDGVWHSPMMVTRGPKNVQLFSQLMPKLQQARVPARISFLIESDGLGGLGYRRTLSSIFGFSSQTNKLYNRAVEEIADRILDNEVYVRWRVTADTWVPYQGPQTEATLRRQRTKLMSVLQQWGAMDVNELPGDAVYSLASTLPGCMLGSPAPISCAPLSDALYMLGLSRPASVWSAGMPLNTPDGKLMPYQMGSAKQAAWIHYTFAPMGGGKSVWENTQDLMFLVMPGLTRMPYLSIIDIGPSSMGLVELVRAMLPPDRQHWAVYKRLRMIPEHSINVFDTPLGCDLPLSAHLEFLINFVSLLCTPDNEAAPGGAVPGVVRATIKMAFDDFSRRREAKRFEASIDEKVTEAVTAIGMVVDEKTSWWEVVDALFAAGNVHMASRAQRYAVPLLRDIAGMVKHEKIRSQYDFGHEGQNICDYVYRCCLEAIDRYPILDRPTQLDLGEARLIALDLDEVAKTERTACVMYMLARHVAASKFFLMPEHVSAMPPEYQAYHAKIIDALRQDPKRLRFDEAHRVFKNASISKQVVNDIETAVRESRKWNLHIGFASQAMRDIPDILIQLSTSIFILGAGDVAGIKEVKERFGLNEVLEYSLSTLGKPGPRGANMLALFKTSEGLSAHMLTNTIPAKLVWAFSTTSEDVKVRGELYARFGAEKALEVLSRRYPGTIKPELERRRRSVEETMGIPRDYLQEILDELAQDAKAA